MRVNKLRKISIFKFGFKICFVFLSFFFLIVRKINISNLVCMLIYYYFGFMDDYNN